MKLTTAGIGLVAVAALQLVFIATLMIIDLSYVEYEVARNSVVFLGVVLLVSTLSISFAYSENRHSYTLLLHFLILAVFLSIFVMRDADYDRRECHGISESTIDSLRDCSSSSNVASTAMVAPCRTTTSPILRLTAKCSVVYTGNHTLDRSTLGIVIIMFILFVVEGVWLYYFFSGPMKNLAKAEGLISVTSVLVAKKMATLLPDSDQAGKSLFSMAGQLEQTAIALENRVDEIHLLNGDWVPEKD